MSSDFLSNRYRDWGDECGRGFYEASDKVCDAGRRLLVCGMGRLGVLRADLPNGRVVSLRNKVDSSAQTFKARVGADDVHQTNRRVYSE